MAGSLYPILPLILLLTGTAVGAGIQTFLPLTSNRKGTIPADEIFVTIDVRNVTTSGLKLGRFRKPKKQDIDNDMLTGELHDNFDPEFMSIQRPTDSQSNKSNKKMEEFADQLVAKLLAEARRSWKKGGNRQIQRAGLQTEFVQAAQAWNEYETERWTEYRWIDLTRRFWPRWIKTGRCSQNCTSRGSSCHQVEGEKVILRWKCLDLGGKPGCFWLPTTVNLVTGCWSTC